MSFSAQTEATNVDLATRRNGRGSARSMKLTTRRAFLPSSNSSYPRSRSALRSPLANESSTSGTVPLKANCIGGGGYQ